MSITTKPYGKTASGIDATLYVMTNKSGASVEISDFGGYINALNVPDRDGKLGSVVLGFPQVSGHSPANGYIGALIGRVGNRIANGKCTVSGQELTLACNSGEGTTHLHGGNVGFDSKLWSVTPVEGICEDSLILKYTSPDGEEGYPGTLKVMVTYTFTDENELILRYEAVSDKDTLCNLTNHTYFNLGGEGSGQVLDHVFEMNADTFTVTDAGLIPTGEMRDVTGTAFDLRDPITLREVFKKGENDPQMQQAHGLDHNFNINDFEAGLRFGCHVEDPKTGRTLDMFTDMPAVQLYTGCMLETDTEGICGRKYGQYEGFCLETQFAPDSINHPEFLDSVLYAGEKYDFTTIFAFGTDADD